MTPGPDESSTQLALRLGAEARLCTVISSTQLSTSLYEVVLGGDVASVAGVAGNDVMIRLHDQNGRGVRRRYSVRDRDDAHDTMRLWITVDHEGPGASWVATVRSGDVVDVVGPRGKIGLAPHADWHLFVGDASSLAAAARMTESIALPGRAILVVEVDAFDDALVAHGREGLEFASVVVERRGRAPSDATGLLQGLATLSLPAGRGHAYLFGEFHVVRSLGVALLDRGLQRDQMSHKAFWRVGRANADHGEPDKTDS